jgi:SWI/SNF-related matrix-associated actin-dependent regulator of chromatin subfamily A3
LAARGSARLTYDGGHLSLNRFKLFEFNGTTPPLQRHKLITEFQNETHAKPCVFIVTYATAAVGITLTAATRVYLMEPAIDPASEVRSGLTRVCPRKTYQSTFQVQAAGRIHRLGQTKEIHIKRFAFKDSIDEAIASLHTKIKSGDVTLVAPRSRFTSHLGEVYS